MYQAKFYKKLNSGRVQCQLCHHGCIIDPGKTGICRVRQNICQERAATNVSLASGSPATNGAHANDGAHTNGKMECKLQSLVYGFPISQDIDPIEKKPLFHFLPGSNIYSLGTLGCNYACANCQNWGMSQAKNIPEKIEELNFVPPEKIVEDALGSDCKSIAYTYNEPTVFAEYALDIMKLAREHGLKNVWVSNGYMSDECLDAVLPYLDAINIDFKSISREFYRDNCAAKLAPVLENLKRLKLEHVHLEITTLIIPTLTCDTEMLKKIAEFIATELDSDTPWHISRFSPEISWKLKKLPTTSDDIIYQAYDAGKLAGLKYIYVGNIPGDQKENTYCPGCGELAIQRLGYDIKRLDNNGRCAHCDKSLDIME